MRLEQLLEQEKSGEAFLFVDLDGVLADFDKAVRKLTGKSAGELENAQEMGQPFWEKVRALGIYRNLDWMPGAEALWNRLLPFKPTILTGCPKAPKDESGPYAEWAANDKRAWCEKHLGSAVPVICTRSFWKWKYAGPGKILIDDQGKNIRAWEQHKGIGVLYVSPDKTLKELEEIGLFKADTGEAFARPDRSFEDIWRVHNQRRSGR